MLIDQSDLSNMVPHDDPKRDNCWTSGVQFFDKNYEFCCSLTICCELEILSGGVCN